MSNPCLEAVTQELTKAGVPFKINNGGKHVHVHYGQGLEHLHVVAATPSDWRAPHNERAQIKRDLAAKGFVDVAEQPTVERAAVQLVSGAPSCFSYDIASSFDKAHKDVLRAIDRVRDECGPEFDQRNFAPVDYVDAKGRTYRSYRMTRDGFSLVVMGFTGAAATAWKVKYIAAFNALADELQRLSTPAIDLAPIRADMDALVSLIGEVESKTVAPVVHLKSRAEQRRDMRRLTRRYGWRLSA